MRYNTEYNMGFDMEKEYEYICEVCGKKKIMKPRQAYEEGWDYPPFLGQLCVVSPRTCGDCSITDTVWWELTCNQKKYVDLNGQQKETIRRIQMEPVSMEVCQEEGKEGQ